MKQRVYVWCALALSACASEPSDVGQVEAAATTSTPATFGVGGMGLFTSVASIGTTFMAGSDVGGIYLSTNSGTAWSNVSSGLTSHQVQAVTADATGFFIASTSGVSKYDVSTSTLTAATGFVASTSSTDDYATSVLSVAVSPVSGSKVVWAGMGVSTKHWDTVGLNGYASSIYLSTDGGVKFNAASGTVGTGAGLLSNLTVYKIEPHPTDSTIAWAATSSGLYYTSSSGVQWDLVGDSTTATTSGCAPNAAGTTPKTGSVLSNVCLPTNADVRDVEYDGENLYVAVWNNEYVPSTASSVCSGSRYNDATYTYFRGGLYQMAWTSSTSAASAAFTWRMPASTIPTYVPNAYVKCDSKPTGEDFKELTNFPQVELLGSSSLALGAYGKSSSSGLYVTTTTSTATLTRYAATSSNTTDADVDGIVQHGRQGPPIGQLYIPSSSSTIYLTFSRGVLSATPSGSSYAFDHLGHSYSSTAKTWSNTGLDATTATGVAKNYTASNGGWLYILAGYDSALLASKDGVAWKRVVDTIKGSLASNSLYDQDDATHCASGSAYACVGGNTYSISTLGLFSDPYLLAEDGHDGAGDEDISLFRYSAVSKAWSQSTPFSSVATGLGKVKRMAVGYYKSGAISYGSAVLVATEAGVYMSKGSAAFAQVAGSGCPTGKIIDVVTSTSSTSFYDRAYALAYTGTRGSGAVYEINLAAGTCTTVGSSLYYPSVLGLGWTIGATKPTVYIGNRARSGSTVVPTLDYATYSGSTWTVTTAGTSMTFTGEGGETLVSAITRYGSDTALVSLGGASEGDGYVPSHLYGVNSSGVSALTTTAPMVRANNIQMLGTTAFLSTKGAGVFTFTVSGL